MSYSIDSVELERVRLCVLMKVSEELLGAAVDIEREIGGYFTVSMRGYLWGERVAKTVVRYPSDWWNAVVERFAPGWYKRRWPVRYTERGVEMTAVFPDYKPSLPDVGRYAVVTRLTMEYEVEE